MKGSQMSDAQGQQTFQQAPSGGPPAAQYATGSASGPRAGFWQRFGAYLIDIIIVAVVEIIVTIILSKAGAVASLINLVLSWGYFTYFEGGVTGQTLGMRVIGIRVLDINTGGPIGYGRGLIRQVVKILSGLVILLGYLWMLWDNEKQTWHDKAVSSVVVPVDAYPIA
jgi:uncharacterized RDD family membrane protein YckC